MVMNPTALKRASALALVLYAGTAFADARLEARRHFRNGMSLIAQGQYDPGIEELLEAYAIKPHANVLYNIAHAYQDAGRVPEAVDYYRRYLAANPPDAEPVQTQLAKLEASLKNSQSAQQLLDAARPVDLGKRPSDCRPCRRRRPAPSPPGRSPRSSSGWRRPSPAPSPCPRARRRSRRAPPGPPAAGLEVSEHGRERHRG